VDSVKDLHEQFFKIRPDPRGKAMNRGFSIGKQSLGSHGANVGVSTGINADVNGGINAVESIPAISHWLSLTHSYAEARSHLSQSFQMSSFQLGEEIDFNAEDLYLVCQGRVRILCGSDLEEITARGRQVTAILLTPECTFGADAVWTERLPYRAVAASLVRVARLPAAVLGDWLEKFPALHEPLRHQATQRERLIFFRTLTELRSLPSAPLAEMIAPLEVQHILAGHSIADAIPETKDRLWLRQGKISSHHSAPTIGDAWNYPAPVDWIAQTDVQIYRIPEETYNIFCPSDRPQTHPVDSADPSLCKTARPHMRPLSPVSDTAPARTQHPAKPANLVHTFPKPIKRRVLDRLQRYHWLGQQSTSDCGAACLGMLARYWGKKIPLHVLRDLANVNRAGASLKSLAKAAEEIGFQARPVRASLSRLIEQSNPWIAHWAGTHYVVVYSVQGKRMIIADPAVGKRSLSLQEFLEHWTGYALLLDPTSRLQTTDVPKSSLIKYLSALSPYRSLIAQIILFSVLIQAFGLITPLFTQIILDKVVVQKSLSALNVFALGLLLFSLWSLCLSSVRQYLLCYFSNRLDVTLVSGFIKHTLTLPLKFFDSRRVGDVLTRVQENQKIQRFLVQQVVLAWLNFLTGFVYLALMFHYNWHLTLLVLLLIPPIICLTLGATPFLQKVSREIFNNAADQNSVLVEMISGIGTVKSVAVESEMRWRWEDALTHQVNSQFRGQKLSIRLQAANGLINAVGSTALLWYGATLVIQNQLSIGQFVAFNMMVGYVISPVVAVANLWDELQEVLISVERLNDVFEAQPEDHAPALALAELTGAVAFEDITFRYSDEDDRNTLQNISFQVQPGQTIAIVGRSGSGKSTLVKLLEGLYHPTQGRVIIDGHDIRHVELRSLRSQLGVVPQDCFLFSGTILDNITLHRSEYTLEQALEAAKLAEAHTFIQALPLGYQTKVGERGCSLSGGQRQRIAIARALLGNPRILILDEATSSLDTESERRFQQNLTKISQGRTTFAIAHRLSTVRNADQILVLEQGILTEQGNHEELMAARGLYFHLARQQLDL
jgi:ATP-binding cassette, subfamily B, bacterial HlyB/CyaB